MNAKDPGVMDEMQRKKERIMLQSLRRKQQGEENRLRKLEEERLKKEAEAAKEEERNRKKEEEKARKEAILEQHIGSNQPAKSTVYRRNHVNGEGASKDKEFLTTERILGIVILFTVIEKSFYAPIVAVAEQVSLYIEIQECLPAV